MSPDGFIAGPGDDMTWLADYLGPPTQPRTRCWPRSVPCSSAIAPIVSRFAVVPRWVVERTFAWLGRYRRLSKDYEYLTATSEAVIYLAMTRLLLRRLTHP
jgi:transposase